jgi:cobalt/nickel transport system permease protein
MGGSHRHPLFHHGQSPVHRLAPEVKVAAGVLFVAAVAVTPRQAMWAFGLQAGVLAAVIGAARLPVRFVLARLAVVAPFVGFSLFIPFVAGGEQVEVAGVSLSREGLTSTFAIVAKAGIGTMVSILLAGTTGQFEILEGLRRLRAPVLLVTIAAFMLRYLDLLAGELARMRTAMACRGYDPRWLWQARPVASAAGALFVRSYERGERIHAAMLGRGFTGTMPDLSRRRAAPREWAAGAMLPVAGFAAVAAALVVGR